MNCSEKLFITTSVAILGFIITYINSLRLAKRKDKLDRINNQLGDFYGPLYSLLKSNEEAWMSFCEKYKIIGAVFDPAKPRTTQELTDWRLYMTVVFMPANNKIYDVIVSKSDLLIESEMPECLLKLISHIVIYKAVIKKWEMGDYTEHTSVINFPSEVHSYIYKSFESLKREQYEMLH
jgi:hypothetical protein